MSPQGTRYRKEGNAIRPFRELEEMRRRFDEDIARPFMRAIWERIPEEDRESWEARWVPQVDVIERSDHILVRVELPGMKDDIDVSVSEDVLTVRGQKKQESGVSEEDYARHEIDYGTFYRTVTLPVSVDSAKTEAHYEDGVLRVILAKVAGAAPHKVKVSVKKEAA